MEAVVSSRGGAPSEDRLGLDEEFAKEVKPLDLTMSARTGTSLNALLWSSLVRYVLLPWS